MARQAFVLINCALKHDVMVGRFVEQGGSWNLAELYASGGPHTKGHQDQVDLTGRFGIAQGYSGCPNCGNQSYVRCGKCQELTCWAGRGNFTCAACDNSGPVSGGIDKVQVEDFG